MLYLLAASALWACSFGLIGHVLAGLDSAFVASVRMLISLAVFLPLLRAKTAAPREAFALTAVGAVQYGVMYLAYVESFRFLATHQVALFTIFTPLYVTLLHDLLARRFNRFFLLTAVLAVAGTGVVVGARADWKGALHGVLLVQASNLCFAAGQVGYRRIKGGAEVTDREHFAFLYLGAALVTAVPAGLSGRWLSLSVTPVQWATLLYLGVIPSGVGFYLWNVGARRVSSGTLAVLNNAKIPLGIACSLLLFGERADGLRLTVGGVTIMAAVALNEWSKRWIFRRQPSLTS